MTNSHNVEEVKTGARLLDTSDWRRTPSAEYRYFLFDPNDPDKLRFFRTREIRDAIAKNVIAGYCDEEGWSDEVTGICAGEASGFARACNLQHRPKREDFETDEDFEDAEADWPGDFDTTCDYALLALKEPKR